VGGSKEPAKTAFTITIITLTDLTKWSNRCYILVMKLKYIYPLILSSIFLFSIISCSSSKVETEDKVELTSPEPVEEIEAPEPEEEAVDYEDEVEYVEEIDLEEEEYLRSINNLNNLESVTKKQFNEDKAAILKIIEELSKVMDTKNSKKWLTYIEPESINYYSNPVNLRNAQKKLPNKSVFLRSIEDYFYYVFIPSRKRSRVDEIRYISATNIKAVQVKEDYSTVVYYYFKKINDKWYVHLPPV